MANVVARVEKASVQKPYSEQKIEVSFPGDLLYRIEVPEDGVTDDEGRTVFTRDGMRHIMKELTVVLYFETEEADY